MSERDLAKVSRAMTKTYGMILSTGPTGSGKTTSIYAIIKVLNKRGINITTIEDPVEYKVEGANQIQVNTKTNLTFANGLRAILRQDPNYIFVGEIRDAETAGIAVNAALTGHLVLSTLHTNDAAGALPRLIDMHIEPFLAASTVIVIIAQRLVRKICDHCRISYNITEDELAKQLSVEVVNKHLIPVGPKKEVRVYKGKGCKRCHFSGYSGRIGLFEVLELNKDVRQLVIEKKDSDAILSAAIQNGMTSMLDDGIEKISKGLTTIEEVIRVTKIEMGS
jgi:type II secretory ATPase GspE/PulE/Tfp pilus assembly ATPase PilB-like protein